MVQHLGSSSNAKILMRLLAQTMLSICLMSEYSLSMTSSFQIRYFREEGKTSTTFGAATIFLVVVCFGMILLGVGVLRGKTREDLEDREFKLTWGSFYKYYVFEHRYYFVAKILSEIMSGIIIGFISHVPSQLTLLMALQFSMFLYTVRCRPFVHQFQSTCSSLAFVMKMVTYAFLSCFLSASTPEGMRKFAGALAIVLQVTLLLLFNCRQFYIMFRHLQFFLRRQNSQLSTPFHRFFTPRRVDQPAVTSVGSRAAV